WNDPVPVLYEEALRRDEGVMAEGGALVVRTGVHTGRSANDKFIVRDPTTEGQIWWGAVNKPFEPERFDALRRRMLNYFEKGQVYVQDCWAGADPEYRLAVRVITESAWHALFARNMFRAPTAEELTGFEPGFTVLHAPGFTAKPERDGTRSDVFILVNFAERMVLIGGTSYAGEIKKSIFSILNHLLPERDVLPMHCSANVGPKGDSAIFFGL